MVTGLAAPKGPSKPRTIDATRLAWWAEEAHGKQGKSLYIVLDDEGIPQMVDQVPPGKQPLLEVITKGTRGPLSPALEKVSIKPRGREEVNLLAVPRLEGCDALFWTVSSIEKFLFPYYYAQRLYSDDDIGKLRKKYLKDDNLVAVLHRAPSKPLLLDTTDFCALADNMQGDEIWVPITDYLKDLKE